MTAAFLALLLSFGAVYAVQNGSVATVVFRVPPPQSVQTPTGDVVPVKKRRHEHDSSSYDEISVETLEKATPHQHWTPLVIFLFIAAVLIGMILIILAILFYIRVFRAQIGYQAMKAEPSRKDTEDFQGLQTVTYQPPPIEASTQTKSDASEPKKEGDKTCKWTFRARNSDEELKKTLRLQWEEEERKKEEERRAQKMKEEEEEQKRMLRIKQLEEEQQRRKLKLLEEEARRAKEAEEAARRAKEAEEAAKRAKEAEEAAKAASEARPSIKRKKGRRTSRNDREQDDSGQTIRGGRRRNSAEVLVRKKREQIDVVQQKDQVSLQDDEDDTRVLSTLSQMRLDLQFKQDSKGKSKCTMKAYVDPPVDGSVTLDTQNDDSPPDDGGNVSPACPRPVVFQLQNEGRKRRSYDLGNLRRGAKKSTELRVTRSASSVSSEETNEVEEVDRLAGPSSQPPKREAAKKAKRSRRRNNVPEEDKTESSREKPTRALDQIKALIDEMERRGIGE